MGAYQKSPVVSYTAGQSNISLLALLPIFRFNQLMKKNTITSAIGIFGLASLVAVSSLSAQRAPAAPVRPPVTPAAAKLSDAEVKEISSYLLGLQSSANFAGAGLTSDDLDMAQVSKGFLAGLKGEKPTYAEAKIQAAMKTLGERIQARALKKAEDNLTTGKVFLAENGKREGVKTSASGLQYEILKAGKDKKYVPPAGGAPDPGTQFMVNYRGTLIDGTEFDKSPEGEPVPMTLQAIAGLREALSTIPIGAKWKLFIPSELAYGSRPFGSKIAGNNTLIFELELLEIKAAPPAPARPGRFSPGAPMPSGPRR